jgi:hypothetical protein
MVKQGRGQRIRTAIRSFGPSAPKRAQSRNRRSETEIKIPDSSVQSIRGIQNAGWAERHTCVALQKGEGGCPSQVITTREIPARRYLRLLRLWPSRSTRASPKSADPKISRSNVRVQDSRCHYDLILKVRLPLSCRGNLA